ncbi:hypothetical protein M3Y97_00810900 [Aphelenchoides bicaudatus]|nr:hypothetical protein M3Y97_00810900 [Aphelenchoides bicaudatus]
MNCWQFWALASLLVCFRPISADCPRKQAQERKEGGVNEAKAPAFEPPEQFVQSTFIHNPVTEEDQIFSIIVTEKLRELRKHLKEVAKLTIDNENLDCNDHQYPKCKEFPPKSAYHFLIIEDPTHGAVVYSLDRKQNKLSENVENALLDAFSRHSGFSLMSYASSEAQNAVGFVREVSVEELEKFLAENQQKRDNEQPTIFKRSPFELQLMNERILELRSLEADTSAMPGLRAFRAGELSELIDLDEKRPVFVLFWTNVNSVSVHVYQLWRRIVAKLYEMPEFKTHTVFGHVPCHEESDLCTAFGIMHQDYRTVFAYRMSRKFASQFGIGDETYYENWIRMVMYGSPHKLENEEELKQARRGILSGFPESDLPRAAITIGIFPTEESEEFQSFKKIAQMLFGRYHFVYYIQEGSKPTISTVRAQEKTKRNDYKDSFDYSSLIAHITQNSIPSVLNFSRGFTSDVVYRSSKSMILLVHNNHQTLLQELADLAASNDYRAKYYLAHVDSSYSLPVDGLLEQLSISAKDLPAVLELQKEEIRVVKKVEGKLVDAIDELSSTTHVKKLERTKAHPMKYLQREHVNHVFGVQEVELLPEPIIAPTYSHDRQSLDVGAAGGCPMMAHLSGSGGTRTWPR